MSFRWRRELPWILLAMAVAIGVRVWTVPYTWTWFHSDSAVGALMAKHIGQGTGFPLFLYGQRYVGTLEAFVAAPLVVRMPGDPRAYAIPQCVVFVLLLALVYRLYHRVGGRAGAIAGTLALAVGTPWLVMMTAGRHTSYLTTLVVGVCLLLLGPAYLARPTRARAFGGGFLVGLAWWNNPQIAHFLAPLAVAFWAAGRTSRARQSGQLRVLLGRRARRHCVVVGAAALGLAGSLALGVHGPLALGGLSLGKPPRYIVRAAVLLVLALAWTEWRLAGVDRRRWLGLGLAGAAGAVLGHLPALAAGPLGQKVGLAPAIGVDPRQLPGKWSPLWEHIGFMTLGEPGHVVGLSPALQAALAVGRWLLIALALIAVLDLLRARWAQLTGLLCVRPVALGHELLLLLMAGSLSALYLTYAGPPAVRYLVPLAIPAAGLVAWGVGRLARWRAAAAAVAGGLVVGYLLLAMSGWVGSWLPTNYPRPLLQLAADLERRGLTRGRADYPVAYLLSFATDERIVLRCSGPRHHDRIASHVAAVDRARRLIWIFDDRIPADAGYHAALLQSKDVVRARWRVGPYRVVQVERSRR